MKEWIIASWQGMIVGGLISYVAFEKPQWAKDATNWLLVKLHLKSPPTV